MSERLQEADLSKLLTKIRSLADGQHVDALEDHLAALEEEITALLDNNDVLRKALVAIGSMDNGKPGDAAAMARYVVEALEWV